jgi:hypothetical protein
MFGTGRDATRAAGVRVRSSRTDAGVVPEWTQTVRADAARFRQAMRDGLIPDLPRGALDCHEDGAQPCGIQ